MQKKSATAFVPNCRAALHHTTLNELKIEVLAMPPHNLQVVSTNLMASFATQIAYPIGVRHRLKSESHSERLSEVNRLAPTHRPETFEFICKIESSSVLISACVRPHTAKRAYAFWNATGNILLLSKTISPRVSNKARRSRSHDTREARGRRPGSLRTRSPDEERNPLFEIYSRRMLRPPPPTVRRFLVTS